MPKRIFRHGRRPQRTYPTVAAVSPSGLWNDDELVHTIPTLLNPMPPGGV